MLQKRPLYLSPPTQTALHLRKDFCAPSSKKTPKEHFVFMMKVFSLFFFLSFLLSARTEGLSDVTLGGRAALLHSCSLR